MHLRLLLDGPAEAAWNMAVDEALLLRGEGATLRLYAWSPHAVSLGYFQRLADFRDLPAGTPIVRRLTGGGAIHHGEEVTFSLALDTCTLPRDIATSYRVLHDAAIAALAQIGAHGARLAEGAVPGARPEERWCFAAPGRDDVVTGRGKLLGSAQRRIATPRARVLHHGSIVLRRPSLTPFVAATEDLAAGDPDFAARLRSALCERFAEALSLSPRSGTLTEAERALAVELSNGRYRDPGFLARY